MQEKFNEIFFDRAFRCKSFCSMDSAHFHPHHELYYIVNGKAKYFIGSELFILNPGDFIFIPQNDYHKTQYISNTETERILIFFDEEFIGKDFLHYLEMPKKEKLIQIANENMHAIRSLLRKIEDESTMKLEGYVEMQKMYLRQLLILFDRHGQKAKQQLNATHTMMQDAAKYISANFAEDLNLTDISHMFSLSPVHFGTQFKKVTGVGFKNYITITRISAAKAMFDAGEKNITKVAYACGFNDSNYFIKVFKEIMGVTPKKYSTTV
ncbi:MAG: AraC family transcriptional regulator [Clostridia bacterium]|nr:AraC family transcriptional regulator [Clostridia bacterium]